MAQKLMQVDVWNELSVYMNSSVMTHALLGEFLNFPIANGKLYGPL